MAFLPQALTRRVEFPYQGKPWPLVFTYRALFECQELTGIPMLSETLMNPSASLVRALVYAALVAAGAQCAIEPVGNAVGQLGLVKSRKLVTAAWAASMPEVGREAEREPDPPLDWIDIWAAAREFHHLGSDEWQDMTPRMFYALEKVRLEQMQWQEMLVGQVCAATVNFSFCRPEQGLSAEEFMLHKFPQEEEPHAITGEYIMAQTKAKPRIVRMNR